MKVNIVKNFSERVVASCLIIPFFEHVKPVLASSLDDENIRKTISFPADHGDFSGKAEQVTLLYNQDEKAKEQRILLVGLGKEKELTPEKLRNCFAAACKVCQKNNFLKINLLFPEKCQMKDLNEALLEGVFLTNYLFDRLKNLSLKGTDKKISLLEEVSIIGGDIDSKLVEKIDSIATATHLSRDLVNNNADDETPQKLAQVAKQFEEISPKVKVTVFDKERIIKEKMGLLLAVNQGSCIDPAFIIVEYTGNPKEKDRTVLIGKGITYDSGGLCLKPPTSMDTMKSDMAGAAAVLGTMYAAAAIDLKKNVTAIIPATENSIGSKSYKPGDVYSGYSGKTVEVINTDAEGRLVLADAISYAVDKIKPDRIIDIATLTGAIVVSLGEEIAGLFCNDDDLIKSLQKSSEKTGELLWPQPLHGDYKKQLKSDIADIRNIGIDRRGAGSITAALFLESFLSSSEENSKKVPWAHIDIGGTAYYSKPQGYYTSLATGYGVRLLLDFLENL